jgi:hypothetical protein
MIATPPRPPMPSPKGPDGGIDVIDYLRATSTCGSCSMPPGVPPVKQSQSALLYGFEAGYNFKFFLVTIRPQLGLRKSHLLSAYGDPTPGPSTASNHFYLEPASSASFPRSALRGRPCRCAPRVHGAGLRVDGPRADGCHLLTGATCGRACARRKKQSLCTFPPLSRGQEPPTANRRAWRWPREGRVGTASAVEGWPHLRGPLMIMVSETPGSAAIDQPSGQGPRDSA